MMLYYILQGFVADVGVHVTGKVIRYLVASGAGIGVHCIGYVIRYLIASGAGIGIHCIASGAGVGVHCIGYVIRYLVASGAEIGVHCIGYVIRYLVASGAEIGVHCIASGAGIGVHCIGYVIRYLVASGAGIGVHCIGYVIRYLVASGAGIGVHCIGYVIRHLVASGAGIGVRTLYRLCYTVSCSFWSLIGIHCIGYVIRYVVASGAGIGVHCIGYVIRYRVASGAGIGVHCIDYVIRYLVASGAGIGVHCIAFGTGIGVHGIDKVVLYLVAFGGAIGVHSKQDKVVQYIVAFGAGVRVHGIYEVVLYLVASAVVIDVHAICDGKTVFTGACNKYYPNDYQKTKDKGIVRSSGGFCSSPDTCTNCNDGFYSNGPYCEMCGPIANCNHRRCTSGSNQVCAWCDGEVKYSPYWRAYTSHLDTTKCQKACSWRSDSTRCYPGTCSNELAANCQCAPNFGGTHCENIQDTPAIEYNHCKFTDDQGINIVENEPNYVQQSHPIIWTNFLGYTKMKTSMVAKYIQPADNRDPDSYITGFRVGVIEQRTTMSYYSAGSVTPSVKTLTCPGMHRDQPVDFQTCPMDFSIWNGMGHDDKYVI
ncbi:unnamed protein product [Mytilus edulis]|uniref:EGF-like domain-containing protein n=1 Tax=Mytilus edulis TaxID=6550 RepID=A0A8S3V149_MYTED|nr:unnamed protein product [Mytilus edulis]